jgi:hypothetical protein
MSRPNRDQPVLIAYDGSPHAKAAVEQAARLLSNGPAVVADQAIAKLDQAAQREAHACAAGGARLA